MLNIKQETISIFTQDNIRLDADLYRPETKEKLPILLMRQPYGRKIASTVVYAHPRWYAAQGYIVVIQDVRGRGSSEGNSKLFETEIRDGLDTLNYLAELSGSTGEVGMYGFSYQGMTQLYAAASQATNLKTICPAMIAYNLYEDWAYENGAFCLQNNLGWAIQLAAEKAKKQGDFNKFQKLYQAARNLPLYDSAPVTPSILEELAPDSFYFDWLNEPANSPYWQDLSPQYGLAKVDLPMLHIGGWFDPHLRGNLKLYQAMRNQSQHPQFLTIGPWGHLPWGKQLASKNYSDRAVSEIDSLQIAWFDHFLKDKPSDLFVQSGCKLFQLNSNQWQDWEDFTPKNYQTYYLKSTGLAAVNENNGQLVTSLAEDFAPTTDYFVHDPWRPVPSLGGHGGFSVGQEERSHLDCRTDIVTYTSPALTEDLTILGSPLVEIEIQADSLSFDLCAIFSQINHQDQVYNICQGYQRINTSKIQLKLALQATFIKIPKGDRLRLSLSGACFPAYAVNSGTGKKVAQERLIDQQVITIALAIDSDFSAKLILPLTTGCDLHMIPSRLWKILA